MSARLDAGRAALAMLKVAVQSCIPAERRVLLAEAQQVVLAAHETLDPADRDAFVAALVAHVRCIRPEQMSPLSLWPPTEAPPTSAPGPKAA